MDSTLKKIIGENLFQSKCYHDVLLQRINKKDIACYFDGKEYKTLNPKDTECSFSYFRLISEEHIYADVGYCNSIIGKIKENYRFVFFSKEKISVYSVLLQFTKLFPADLNMVIKNINRDENKLLKTECGISDSDIKVKSWTYFSIDFQISYKYDNCLINECL